MKSWRWVEKICKCLLQSILFCSILSKKTVCSWVLLYAYFKVVKLYRNRIHVFYWNNETGLWTKPVVYKCSWTEPFLLVFWLKLVPRDWTCSFLQNNTSYMCFDSTNIIKVNKIKIENVEFVTYLCKHILYNSKHSFERDSV